MIDIQRYAGKQAHLNSLFARTALKPTDWLITSKPVEKAGNHFRHARSPNHYLGLGAFHRRFPNAPVKVASREIRDDIIGFSQWMESVGWLDSEPTMKPKSNKNPDGFDYAGIVQVFRCWRRRFSSSPQSQPELMFNATIPAASAGT